VLDLVIAGAVVVDGSGAPGFPGWVGVAGDRVAVVGRRGEAPPAARTIEAAGAAVVPGSVDVHSHADLSALVLPEMPSVVRQGVTTVVVGNCGASPWPLAGFAEAVELAYGDPADVATPAWAGFGAFLEAVDAARPAVNVAALVGHGAVRLEVLGRERRAPSEGELAAMRRLVAAALEDGAVGLSTGLIYAPGIHAATEEVVALTTESAARGGLYASHLRGEGRDLFRAVDEAISIGRRAGLPVHVSHLKCESSLVWGRAEELLARVHDAEDATADAYPYAAWNSSLASLLPPWASPEDLPRIVADPPSRERLRRAVEEGEPGFQSSVDGVGWERIRIVGTAEARLRGHDLASIADGLGTDPFDACVRLVLEDPSTTCIGHAMREDDVRAILADPEVFVASDGSAVDPGGVGGDLPVHPREYGTFPRALALARDEGLLGFAAAVRTMTSLPAERFGLDGRGRIAEGAFADLVVLDPASVRDVATFDDPHRFPEGIRAVVVNGAVAWDGGAIERAGRALRRTRAVPSPP
jgi:N-acyl-D-aspartate/D-glutamate deacylase